MRRQRGLVKLMGLATLVGLGFVVKPALAAVTTEQSASILVFPKVISDGTRDTIIQITNTSNNMRHAHCFYVNGALAVIGAPEGPNNLPLWQETDFDIWLTKQQPTHWVVSKGRLDFTNLESCHTATCDPVSSGSATADCCDAGIQPGHIPPVGTAFQGELKCIEVDATGAPISGNAFIGAATLEDLTTGDVAKYNAVGLVGFDTNNGDNTLCLGGTVTNQCPSGAEYAGCPNTWLVDHAVTGASDPVVAAQTCPTGDTCTSSMDTDLTVATCSEDFENQIPQSIVLQFSVINEFEQAFSGSTTVTCWQEFDLNDVNGAFNFATLGSDVAQTRIRTVASPVGDPNQGLGILTVIDESHSYKVTGGGGLNTTQTALAAMNTHSTTTDQANGDVITIPGGQGASQP